MHAARNSLSIGEQEPAFRWRVRVYHEDTDAGGIVYYANYLKFFERCRTEWLRSIGIDQSELARGQGIVFVVAEADVKYFSPARLDDELAVEARATDVRRCSLAFEQRVTRAGRILAQARVKVACVDSEKGAPTRLPEALAAALRTPRNPGCAPGS